MLLREPECIPVTQLWDTTQDNVVPINFIIQISFLLWQRILRAYQLLPILEQQYIELTFWECISNISYSHSWHRDMKLLDTSPMSERCLNSSLAWAKQSSSHRSYIHFYEGCIQSRLWFNFVYIPTRCFASYLKVIISNFGPLWYEI